MSTPKVLTLLAFESVGVFMISRLWMRKRKRSVLGRIFWTVVLLIPVLGLAPLQR